MYHDNQETSLSRRVSKVGEMRNKQTKQTPHKKPLTPEGSVQNEGGDGERGGVGA